MGRFNQCPTLTNDEDQEDGGCNEENVLGGASRFLRQVRFAVRVVIEVVSNTISPSLLIRVGRRLHLHLAVVSFHVLGQAEARIRVGLPIKLQ